VKNSLKKPNRCTTEKRFWWKKGGTSFHKAPNHRGGARGKKRRGRGNVRKRRQKGERGEGD